MFSPNLHLQLMIEFDLMYYYLLVLMQLLLLLLASRQINLLLPVVPSMHMNLLLALTQWGAFYHDRGAEHI